MFSYALRFPACMLITSRRSIKLSQRQHLASLLPLPMMVTGPTFNYPANRHITYM
jgi:hypothetical protein